jgi:hypothetical protein
MCGGPSRACRMLGPDRVQASESKIPYDECWPNLRLNLSRNLGESRGGLHPAFLNVGFCGMCGGRVVCVSGVGADRVQASESQDS